jgi:plastocyanin
MTRTMVATLLAGTALLGQAIPANAGGGTAGVQVRDDEFDPPTLPVPGETLFVGDTVVWDWVDTVHPHNVRQVRSLFRSQTESSPSFSFSRTFSAGSFPYQCEIHGAGMFGRVKVVIGQDITPSGLPVISWADETTNTGHAFDVQFRIGEDGPWRRWKKDTVAFQGVFGRNDRPVRFNPAKEYWFRTRSQKRTDTPTKVSRWSPPRLWD